MKYYIDYLDKSDDLTHVWVEAESREDARRQVLHEYWDIKEIIRIWK